MLWQHLRHPPAHPLSQRLMRGLADSRAQRFMTRVAPLVSLLGCGSIWVLLSSLQLPLPLFLLAGMIAWSSVYVMLWVIRISATIIRAHENGIYDHLSLAPAGPLGVNWAICSASLHRGDALGWVDVWRRLINGLLIFVVLMGVLTVGLRSDHLLAAQLLGFVAELLLLAWVLHSEHVQAVVIGCLVGMLLPVYQRTRDEAQVWAALLFLALQAVTLVIALLTATVVVPGLLSAVSPTLAGLIVFFVVREAVVVVLWQALANHLNTSPQWE